MTKISRLIDTYIYEAPPEEKADGAFLWAVTGKSQNSRHPSQKCVYIYKKIKIEKIYLFFISLNIGVLYLGFWDKDNLYNKNNNI